MSNQVFKITPKGFQKAMIIAVSEQMSKELLKNNKESRNELHIVSPTGSGKTFMMQQVLEMFLEAEDKQNFTILWISPATGGLLNQSYQTFKEAFQESRIPIIKLEDLLKESDPNKLNQNKIVFTSWEMISSKNQNNIYKSSEQQALGLEEFLLVNNSLKFIGVIDESHRNIGDEESKSFEAYRLFNCELSIHLTATPIDEDIDSFKEEVNSNKNVLNIKTTLPGKWVYVIPKQDVVQSRLITEETYYNIRPNGEDYYEPETELVSVELGLERLKQLQLCSPRYNPLMLIQLSDEGKDNKKIKTEKLPKIEELLQKRGITYRIWLNKDNDKTKTFLLTDDEKDEIKKNNSPIEVLIFKQAVAVGWDCPRAKILVKERNTKSKTFDEQVLGRIRRIPGGDHLDDNILLKHAYVYSHHIKTEKTQLPPKLGEYDYSPLKNEIKNLDNRPFLIPLFSKQVDANFYYDQALSKLKKLDFDGFVLNKSSYLMKRDSGVEETYSDYVEECNSLKTKLTIGATKSEVFYYLLKIKNHFKAGVSPLLLIQLFHDLFTEKFESQSYEETYNLIANNQSMIENYLNNVFNELLQEIYEPKLVDSSFYEQNYQIPEALAYRNNLSSCNDLTGVIRDPLLACYVYEKPFVSDKLQSTEQAFVNKINGMVNYAQINYWFKNSTKSDSFFLMRPDGLRFYPDFLIQTQDGTVWIYEIKGYADSNLDNNEEMKMKKIALDSYIKLAHSMGCKVYGEIISSNNDGEWFCWTTDGYWLPYDLFQKKD